MQALFQTAGPRSVNASRHIKTVALMGLLSFFLSLGGCDQQNIDKLEEGVSTEADVRSRFGEPEKIWTASDMASVPLAGGSARAATEPGARTFEYNRQTQGMTNYMITIGPTGTLSAIRQVLTPQNFQAVQPGMSMEQVRKMLGKPMKVTPYALSQQTHYDWRYLNPPNTAMIFTVVFNTDLRVVSTASAEEESVYPKSR
jgi:outer membrane protein assembly factor BamE (lipoprotein component of BamABCDE complex)